MDIKVLPELDDVVGADLRNEMPAHGWQELEVKVLPELRLLQVRVHPRERRRHQCSPGYSGIVRSERLVSSWIIQRAKETSRALSRWVSLPFEQLLEFPLGDNVSRALEPVEEHDATEMIILVLENTGDEVCELAFDLPASGGLVASPDAAMTGDLATDSGDAEAAFPTFDHVLGSLQYLRVDHDLGLHRRRLGIAGAGARGHDEEGNRFINLRRRDAHAISLAQRRKHVVDQCPHLDRGGAIHRSGKRAKDGMAKLG